MVLVFSDSSFYYLNRIESKISNRTQKKSNRIEKFVHRFTSTDYSDADANISGVIHAGLGWTSVNKLFSALNLPLVHHTTMKCREREVGVKIEELAESSCSLEAKREVSMM